MCNLSHRLYEQKMSNLFCPLIECHFNFSQQHCWQLLQPCIPSNHSEQFELILIISKKLAVQNKHSQNESSCFPRRHYFPVCLFMPVSPWCEHNLLLRCQNPAMLNLTTCIKTLSSQILNYVLLYDGVCLRMPLDTFWSHKDILRGIYPCNKF